MTVIENDDDRANWNDFLYRMSVLNSWRKQWHGRYLMAGGIQHTVSNHCYDYDNYNDNLIWITDTICLYKSDIMESFCNSIVDDEGYNECPYVKTYWGDYYTPSEQDCPAEFTPVDKSCPYNQSFIEQIIEPLNSDVEDWYL